MRGHSSSRRRRGRARAVEDIDPEADSDIDDDDAFDAFSEGHTRESSASAPSFVDPFTPTNILPPVPPIPESAAAAARDRSKSTPNVPVVPPRSALRPQTGSNIASPVSPAPGTPNSIPTQLSIRSHVTANAPLEREGRSSKFARLFGGGGGQSKGNSVLRKSDRDRERSLERKYSESLVREQPLPPVPPRQQEQHTASIEIVDADGRVAQGNVDAMYMLRQLRAI